MEGTIYFCPIPGFSFGKSTKAALQYYPTLRSFEQMVLRSSIAKHRYASSSHPTSHPTSHTLQLWVEHSLNLSSRSAILVAKLNANHASAKTDQLAVSVNDFFPLPSKRHAPLNSRARLNVSRDLEKRHALRNLRRQKLQSILQGEQLKRLEEKRKAQQAAQYAAQKEAQQAAQQEVQQAAQEAAQQAAQQAAQREAQQAVSRAGPHVSSRQVKEKSKDLLPENQPGSATFSGGGQGSKRSDSNFAKLPSANYHLASGANHQSRKHAPSHLENLLPAAEHALNVWKQVSEQANEFRQNFSVKKMRLNLKKRINLGVNQVSASIKQVSTKVRDLSGLIYETKSAAGPQGEAFAMKEVAQRLVKEADGSVSLNQTAAFAVAAVIVGVSASVPDTFRMRDVFLGAFYDYCMFTIPTYARRRKDEDMEEYRTRIGYKEGETAESYLERMCGCVSLFAAVIQMEDVYTGSNLGIQVSNPFPLDLGWSWLARIVNMEQKSLTPAIVFAFLETAGYGLAKRYKKQFAKLIAMVQRAVVIDAVKSAPKGPISRLDLFISEFISAGCTIKQPPQGKSLPIKDAENL